MERDEMGQVTAEVEVENLEDSWESQRGLRTPNEVRRMTISDALVDTGATTLSLPRRLIEHLGLSQQSERQVIMSSGKDQAAMYTAVRLTIQGRTCTVDVMEVPDDVPALIGQVPLELLDFVVDPVGRRLIGNPAHGGEHVIELL